MIYADIFIQYSTNVFPCIAFIILLDFHWLIEYVFIDARGKEEVGRGEGIARDIYSSWENTY